MNNTSSTISKWRIPVIFLSLLVTAPAMVSAQSQINDSALRSSVQVGAQYQEPPEGAALLPNAKISLDQAVRSALSAYPKSHVFSAALDNQNGSLVYSVQVDGTPGGITEVYVDAGNGKILGTGKDTEDRQTQGQHEERASRESETNRENQSSENN